MDRTNKCTWLIYFVLFLFPWISIAQEGYWDQQYKKIGTEVGTGYTVGYVIENVGFYILKDGQKGFCDISGNLIIPTKYNEVQYLLGDSIFFVRTGSKEDLACYQGKVGLISLSGVILLEPTDGYQAKYDKKTGCSIVEKCARNGSVVGKSLYSPNGKKLLECDEKSMGVISEGLVSFKQNGLWGFMDAATGRIVIPAEYTSVTDFKNGMAKVSKKHISYLISNPLQNGGGRIVSQLSLQNTAKSDIDTDIPQTQRVQENTFVVILANQNYSDFVAPYAINDGVVVKEYCSQTLGIPAANIMYYEDATLNNIQSAVLRLNDLADAYEGDASIIVYFAGQGAVDKQSRPYLLPSDADIDMIHATAYPVQSLYDQLGSLNVRSAIVFLDCSFSGYNRNAKPIQPHLTAPKKSVPATVKGNLTVFMAASSGETSFSDEENGHGIFTYHLCKKIKESKGDLTIGNLAESVVSQVGGSSMQLTGKKQNVIVIYSNPNNKKTLL